MPIFSFAFLTNPNNIQDDLLFFVEKDRDPPVIVKRRPSSFPTERNIDPDILPLELFPHLPPTVDWQHTFSLNFVAQVWIE
jgi:hypothetical protein